jgi:hypothetical protein
MLFRRLTGCLTRLVRFLPASFNPISAAERTEANEANEGQVDTRAAARTICLQARGREIPSSFVPFVFFCEPSFEVRVKAADSIVTVKAPR